MDTLRYCFIVFATLSLGACKKDPVTVIVPEACMELDHTVLTVGDTLEIKNCGQAESHMIIITEPAREANYSGISYTFGSDNLYRHVFTSPGRYVVKVISSTPRAPVDEARQEVEVTP